MSVNAQGQLNTGQAQAQTSNQKVPQETVQA